MNEDKIILYNKALIPKIGFGVYQMPNDKNLEDLVLEAINSGYRIIDTAAAYLNEEAVGRAIKRSKVPREELFIITKLWITDTSYEKAKEAFYRSLKRLDLDYIDLYLIHQHYNDYYGAWKALEELYLEGHIKAIGVDNFKEDRLEDFIFFNKIKPMVNMIECNPLYQRENELKYLKDHQIQMIAWSPLSQGNKDLFDNEILKEIAKNHNKTVAQIVLRWLTLRGIVPIVKSKNPIRIKENIDIFDFNLSKEEMEKIRLIDKGHSCFIERNNANEVSLFLNYAIKYNV